MAFNQVLKTHIQPSIKLIELGDFDTSKESKTPAINRQEKSTQDFSQKAGVNSPFVKLGGKVISKINSLVIKEDGFIPSLDLIFTDEAGEFSGNNFPKRNLMVSVFINSGNPKLKPVRSDYLITSVKSIPVTNRGDNTKLSSMTTYYIKAELFIPRLYNNVSKSYRELTSVDTIKKVCTELGMGFAQNEFTTSDKMTWINTNTSPANFLREIVNHAYQDDDSFFTGFISKELIFNFVNINEQLKQNEPDETFSSNSNPMAQNLSQNQKNTPIQVGFSESTVVNFLTNLRSSANHPNYIYEANLISNQGEVLRKEGYKKKIYYYDHFEADETKKFKDFFVAPTNTEGISEETMLIPDDEGMEEIGNKKWMNINYGNTHEHWNAARVFNAHNLKELEKIKMRVLLRGINFQVIRGMAIHVMITTSMGEKMKKETDPTGEKTVNPKKQELNEETLDEQLTGIYYVKEAKYTFDPSDPHFFITELILARREWLPNKTKFTANA